MAAAFSGFLATSSALGFDNFKPILSLQHKIHTVANTKDWISCNCVPNRISGAKIQNFSVKRVRPMFAMSRGGNYGLKFDDDYEEEPYWLQLFKESIRAWKMLFSFLIQQPGQLKYIEWPSFKDTLRTAYLTLVLVAVIIVALASIDSALSFVLALLLRRPA